MKKSAVLDAFRSHVMDRVKEIENRPSKMSYSSKRAIFNDYAHSLQEAYGLLKTSTSPKEYEDVLLAMLDGPHLGDPAMGRFEMIFLDLVLSEMEWDDE